MDIDCVIIGINAEATLGACLDSILQSHYSDGRIHVYYVDGGSTDGSVMLAAEYEGVTVLQVHSEYPTPGRGRNEGWRAGTSPLVQFLDSDTVMDPDWLAAAAGEFSNDSVAAVCGRRQEIHPDASVYNWIADQEWNSAPGETDAFGGDVMVRRQALETADGYDEDLVGGEDPELSQRLRQQGGRILQLDRPMTQHDLGMTRVGQYVKRAYRTGYAFAAVTARHWRKGGGFWVREAGRIVTRGGGALALTVIGVGATALHPAAVLALVPAALLLCFPRLFRVEALQQDKGLTEQEATVYAWHCSMVVVPQFLGMLRFILGALTGCPLRNRRQQLRTRVSTAATVLACLVLSVLCCSCQRYNPYQARPPGMRRRNYTTGRTTRNAQTTRSAKTTAQANVATVRPPARTATKPAPKPVPSPTPVPNPTAKRAPSAGAPPVLPTAPTPSSQRSDELAKIRAFSRSVPKTYLLGPGDVLDLKVWGYPELSDPDIVVSPDGAISVLRLGLIKVKGRAVSDVTAEITRKLEEFYEAPEVSISVRTYNNNKVFVLGKVANPGVVHFDGTGTLVEALSKVGGPRTAAAEAPVRQCCIVRGDREPVWIDLQSLLEKGNMALNVQLQNGDIVYVPKSEQQRVYVVGEVQRAGPQILDRRFTYIDALMLAGGPTKYANTAMTFVIRADAADGGHLMRVDLKRLLNTGDRSQNIQLQDTDIVFVPKRKLAKYSDVAEMLLPGMRFFSLSLDALERLGVLAELREQLWGQSGFVEAN